MTTETVVLLAAFCSAAVLGFASASPRFALAVMALSALIALIGAPLGWYRSDSDAEPIGSAINAFLLLGLPTTFIFYVAALGRRLRRQSGRDGSGVDGVA